MSAISLSPVFTRFLSIRGIEGYELLPSISCLERQYFFACKEFSYGRCNHKFFRDALKELAGEITNEVTNARRFANVNYDDIYDNSLELEGYCRDEEDVEVINYQ